VSSGSGSATLTLLGDVATAVLRHSHQGLTGPLTAAHIHAGDGSSQRGVTVVWAGLLGETAGARERCVQG
jgi:hypothetical protein